MFFFRLMLLLNLPFLSLVSLECQETFDTRQITTTKTKYYQYGEYQDYDAVEDKIFGKTCTCVNLTLPIVAITCQLDNTNCIDNCSLILDIKSLERTIVPISAFYNFYLITKLQMNNLNISQLTPGAFVLLNQLKDLDMSENNISEIRDGVLNTLQRVEILDLSSNNIKDVSSHFLAGTKYVQFLNLSVNSLTAFDVSLIYSLNYVSLDLSYNILESINFNNTVSHFNQLNLSNNAINTVKGCWYNFKYINLRLNKLKSVKDINCQNDSSTYELSYLDLGQNLLLEIPNHFKHPIISLDLLMLDHNNISEIPHWFSEQFPSLSHLNLSFNQLSKLEYGSFDTFKNLKVLDLSHNDLTYVKRYFHTLSNLQKLYLNDNRLKFLDPLHLSKDFPILSEIHLDKNYFLCENVIEISKMLPLVKGETKGSAHVNGIACLEANKTNYPFSHNTQISSKTGHIFQKISVGNFDQTTMKYIYIGDDNTTLELEDRSESYPKLNRDFNKTSGKDIFNISSTSTEESVFKLLSHMQTNTTENQKLSEISNLQMKLKYLNIQFYVIIGFLILIVFILTISNGLKIKCKHKRQRAENVSLCEV